MLTIFALQNTVLTQFETYIRTLTNYSAYTITCNKVIDSTEDYLPALQFSVTKNAPENIDDSDTLGNHTRSFTLNCRILVASSNVKSVEEIADELYDTVNTFMKTNNKIHLIGNPTLTRLFDTTNAVCVADLEIPVFFRTNYITK